MSPIQGHYSDWSRIDYCPAIPDLLPHAVLPHLSAGPSALDVGCNTGGVCLFLANYGLDVLGVDINRTAVEEARLRARKARPKGSLRFAAGDFLKGPLFGTFDVVLLIRLLTCFPDAGEFQSLLTRAHAHIKPGGLIYIHDFLLAPDSDNYRRRYEAGAKLGWRPGNFAVYDQHGPLLFIAHHHSMEELELISRPYQEVHLEIHDSLSMNGNACRMFEFIGRRL